MLGNARSKRYFIEDCRARALAEIQFYSCLLFCLWRLANCYVAIARSRTGTEDDDVELPDDGGLGNDTNDECYQFDLGLHVMIMNWRSKLSNHPDHISLVSG